MRIKAFAVIDTNVIVSSVQSDSFPRQIFNLITSEEKNVIPIYDKRMLREYDDVLNRKKLNFDKQIVYDALYIVVSNGILINDIEQAKIQLSDRGDIPFFEVKESSNEFDTYLVTGNMKHYPHSDSTVTPQMFIAILKSLDRFLDNTDINYERNLEELKELQTSTEKYTSGIDIVDEMFDTKNKTIKKSFFDLD